MSEILLRCDHVGKKFCRDLKKSLWYGLTDLAGDILGTPPGILRSEEFWAVDDVSFDLRRGECLGLIGRNGAGKTTLLKMLNGLIKPDAGKIMLRGRVGGLIALGAGFDPILTGRENVFVNGSILGLSKKQIHERFDEIVEFAEIGQFIDSPVGNYSSGMQVRLGFAVAAIMIRPDILLLDEVLAVGDLGFRLKCLNLIQELLEDAAVVFVSHSMQFVTRFCTRVAVFSEGQIICNSHDLSQGLQAYYTQCETQLKVFGNTAARIHNEKLWINDAEVLDNQQAVITGDDELSVELDLDLEPGLPEVELRITIEDFSGHPILAIKPQQREQLRFTETQRGVRMDLGNLKLTPGKYCLMFAVVTVERMERLTRKAGSLEFQFGGDHVEWASVIHETRVRCA
ncbi:Teichoic acids export ATP-binding protein TagH [Symmachiella dynata]|uniref:Teichoic acids export ATP-binding protein TagH n=1 Tax=Symmachiella dynata TaxID=2527995 RepID=A0A517ZX36_9PLAN|nr:ABC transporter ATP-binding protein [Symmachiella dynata]QDU47030.1 Teichoic acids export ATP-binding protein TagH [Symmachiella dynata]